MNVISIMSSKKKTSGKTDWQKVKNLTERKINEAAQSDPDALPLSKKELEKFQRVSRKHLSHKKHSS